MVVKLQDAGRDGLSAERLIRIAGFQDAADPGSALARELRHLRAAGWQIDSVGAAGEGGHYVLHNMDVRMRVRLSPEQQAALRRAALVANRGDLADRLGLPSAATPALPSTSVVAGEAGEQLQIVMSALSRHRLLTFRYKGTVREVHPITVRVEHRKWYLQGKEQASGEIKYFLVSRMGELRAGASGSAEVVPPVRHTSLQPMHWKVDPPIHVLVRTTEPYVDDVVRWLSEPAERSVPDAQGRVLLTYVVTNRRALRVRLYELGTRVEILGPPEIRAEIIEELENMGGQA